MEPFAVSQVRPEESAVVSEAEPGKAAMGLEQAAEPEKAATIYRRNERGCEQHQNGEEWDDHRSLAVCHQAFPTS